MENIASEEPRLNLWDKFRRRFRHIPFLESNLTMGPMAFIRFVTGPVRGRFSAHWLGPRGVGFIGTSETIRNFGMSISSLSMGSVVIQELGESIGAADEVRHLQVLDASFLIQMIGSVIVIGGCLLLHQLILRSLFADPAITWVSLLPILLCIPFSGLATSYFQPILFAHGRYDIYSKITSRNAIIELLSFLSLAYFFGLTGAFWAVTCSQFIWNWQLLKATKHLRPSMRRLRWNINPKIGLRIMRGGFFLLCSGIVSYGSLLVLRSIITRRLGENQNGYYQLLLIFTAYYTPLITNGIWAHLQPKLSRIQYGKEFWTEWAGYMTLAVWSGVMVQISLLIMPSKLVSLFFSRDFFPAIHSLPWQFLGDFFFLLTCPCLAVFLAKTRYRASLLCISCASLIMITVCSTATPILGLSALPIGYLASTSFSFLFYFFFIIKLGKKSFDFLGLIWRLLAPLGILLGQVFVFYATEEMSIYRFIVPILVFASAGILFKRATWRQRLLYS